MSGMREIERRRLEEREQVRGGVRLSVVIGADVELSAPDGPRAPAAGAVLTGRCLFCVPGRIEVRDGGAGKPAGWRCGGPGSGPGACGRRGDVFDWVMQRDGVDFRAALERVAALGGISLGRDAGPLFGGGGRR